MNPTNKVLSRQPNSLLAILSGGAACGVLDISAALIVYGFFGARPVRLLQSVASGLLGPRAFEGGLATALLGLFCHFVIAFLAATVYVVAARWMRFLVERTVISGVLYGVAVYFFMNRVVVPLSAARRNPFSLKMMIIGILIHIFCVGTPIAFMARKFLRPRLH